MGKLLVFEIAKGGFGQGFPVVLRLGADGVAGGVRLEGYLPPAPDLPKALEHWQQAYSGLVDDSFIIDRSGIRSINPKPVQRLNVSLEDAANELSESLNVWLNSSDREWLKIRDSLQRQLGETQDEIRLVVQTENVWLRRLPWQEWNLFAQHYPQTEIAVSPTEQSFRIVTPIHKSRKVKILAILGSTGSLGHQLNLEPDRKELERLTKAKVEFLCQPSKSELRDKLWQQDWQILFFAGHSGSFADAVSGWLQLNQQDQIAIDDLKESLTQAIARGLQLVILNSCDGLGLAKQLEDLRLPQMLVMRERVPDEIAQEFLRYFLAAFAARQGNKSLHVSVREARAKLKDSQGSKYPGASWLPVICQQHSDTKPLTWNQLCGKTELAKVRGRNFWLILGASAVSIVVGGLIIETKWNKPVTVAASIAVEKVKIKAERGEYQRRDSSIFQQHPLTNSQLALTLPLTGQAVSGSLGIGDATFPDRSYYKLYTFEGRVGQQIVIEMDSQQLDPALMLLDAQGKIIDWNNGISPTNLNARMNTRLPKNGIYTVLITSLEAKEVGVYSLKAYSSDPEQRNSLVQPP